VGITDYNPGKRAMAAPYQPTDRRPLASRDLKIVQRVAAWLVARDVSPNMISVFSVVFAALAAGCAAATSWTGGVQTRLLFMLTAAFVQARLLANLFDGMVAVGSGKASPLGELYNEVPDRIADPLILIGAGFAAGSSPALGFVAAVLAVFVAYVRAIGASAGAKALFIGPMAKQQRMAAVTAACVYGACVPAWWPGGFASGVVGAMTLALALIVAGSVLTAARRLRRIAAHLKTRAKA
jgi:phosphatidylglycerophosphate synthase